MAFRTSFVIRSSRSAATVPFVVTVQNDAVVTCDGHADLVIVTHYGREVEDADDNAAGTVPAYPAEHAAVVVVPPDPLEAVTAEIDLV